MRGNGNVDKFMRGNEKEMKKTDVNLSYSFILFLSNIRSGRDEFFLMNYLSHSKFIPNLLAIY